MNSHHQLKQRNTKKMRRDEKEAKKQKNESDGVKNSPVCQNLEISMPEFGEAGVADEITESLGSPSVVNLESTSNKRKIANLDESFEGDQFLNELEEMQTAAGKPKIRRTLYHQKNCSKSKLLSFKSNRLNYLKNQEKTT